MKVRNYYGQLSTSMAINVMSAILESVQERDRYFREHLIKQSSDFRPQKLSAELNDESFSGHPRVLFVTIGAV